MSINSAMVKYALYADRFHVAMASRLNNIYSHVGTSYKGSSTKKGGKP